MCSSVPGPSVSARASTSSSQTTWRARRGVRVGPNQVTIIDGAGEETLPKSAVRRATPSRRRSVGRRWLQPAPSGDTRVSSPGHLSVIRSTARDSAWTEFRRREQPRGVTRESGPSGWAGNAAARPESEPVRVRAGRGSAGSAAHVSTAAVYTSRADAIAAIRDEIGDCTRCKLHKGRTKSSSASGDPQARLMFIGEGPGADEDREASPFVGRAGQLLTQIIKAMGLTREQVYIANVVKCRPPDNRNPEPDEIEQCSPFLRAQIASIQSGVIVALGKFAAQTLLGPRRRFRACVASSSDGTSTVMPTFHPSYLLRNPGGEARGLGGHEDGHGASGESSCTDE